MSSEATKATPLWATPLWNDDEPSNSVFEGGRYVTLERLVTPCQTQGEEASEIETKVEIFLQESSETPLWRRVVVQSCPPTKTVHASFMLPAEHLVEKNMVCWTSFSDKVNSSSAMNLCVLASPTLVQIWDVYSQTGENLGGHSIPLPFEACGIFSLPQGLLLQRKETVEDAIQFDALNKTWTSTGLGDDEDDGDGFVLKAPPRPMRLRESAGTATSLGSHQFPSAASAVPALFSLSHPLDDILPVSCRYLQEQQMFDNVFEKIIFTGVVEWQENLKQPICVTYHTHKKRHAIWELVNSPSPPPLAPLWQVSSKWRSTEGGWQSHLGMDLDGYFLSQDSAEEGAPSSMDRKDALADALGVRKTPRKNAHEEPRSSLTARRNTASRPQQQTKPNHNNATANLNNLSLLSPLSRLNETANSSTHDVDMTQASPQQPQEERPPLLSLGPFASLHPKVSMNCIFEEYNIQDEASSVFVVSNQQGSGTLTLCLVCDSSESSHDNSKQVQLYSLETTAVEGQHFEVVPGPVIPCIAATPLKSSPIPSCFCSTSGKMATDLLLLHNTATSERKLSLFRNSMHIVDCAMRDVPTLQITHIGTPVGSRVDLTIDPKTIIRANISLALDTSFVGEKALKAMESALFACGKEALAMKLRADCVRIYQTLVQKGERTLVLVDDMGATALGTVVSAMFALEWIGTNVNALLEEKKQPLSSPKTAWEQLMQSEFHQGYQTDCHEILLPTKESEKQEAVKFWDWEKLSQIHSFAVAEFSTCTESTSISPLLFDALHAIYEDFKLHGNIRDKGMRFVGTILGQVCLWASRGGNKPHSPLFLEHYRRDLGEQWLQRVQSSTDVSSAPGNKDSHLSSYDSPPCILSWVDGFVSGKDLDCGYKSLDESSINATCTRTRSLFRIFPILYGDGEIGDHGMARDHGKLLRERDHKVVRALIGEGFTDKTMLRDELPVGVVLPLLEVLYRCRSDNETLGLSSQDAQAWSLIGRDDLCQNAQSNDTDEKKTSLTSQNQEILNSNGLGGDSSKDENSRSQLLGDDKDMDGVCPLEITSSMLFPNDNRIREVGRLLRSSRPTYLNVPRAIEVSDHDYERLKQEKLLLLSRRILALPVGRGMFTIGNLQPVPAEPLPLPDICLVGRVPPTNAMLALDTAECPSDLKVWPEFHNGVAAGLRLPLEADAGEMISKITRTWIVYNRPAESASQHQQNNGNNANTPPPSPIHAHGGLLMALGLRGHLTTLEMTDIFDYLTQGTVTTTVGVLLGMAVNMIGSCDISVSKMLCLHIPSLIPQHFSAIDVASPVQAAAVAGAGLLYQGSSHRMMTEFLLNEIGKRPASDMNVFDREAYTLSCGLALGMVNLCKGEGAKNEDFSSGNAGLTDLRIEDRLYRYIVGGLDDAEMRRRREETDRLSLPSTSAASGNEKCSCINEGDSINTDVTAPGATLALGLIYMMSGNTTIASAIALPDTHFLLEYVRPDFLMLRVIARALILWDEVKPTKGWIDSQLPKAVEDAYGKMRELALNMSQQQTSSSANDEDKYFDRQAIRLIYSHVIAGACFAIGLRFAGTGNREAAAAIFERVIELRDLRDGNDPVSCALRPPAPVLEMCLGCAAISLSTVLAGSGDLEVLRLLKVLRWRCDEKVNYGSHLAYGTAIGLLFLGGGTCTLGREPEDIAALVMAFYPRFPTSTSDNQYHLQALRNLYAIAVKDREFRAVDVDTGESVFVPIEVHFEDSKVDALELTAPCLLFNTDVKPKLLKVASERYYPVTLSIDDPATKRIFYVKRKSAHLSYLQDPHSQRSLLVQTGSFQGYTSLDLIASFTDDPKVLAFAQHFCDVGQSSSKSNPLGPFSVSGFCSRVLHECLLLDSEEALPLYLALRSAISLVQAGIRSGVTHVWDFRLIRSYYEQRRRLVPDDSPRLLNSEIIAYLSELVENAIIGLDGKPLLQDGSVSIYFDVPLSGSHQGLESMDLS